MIDRAVKPCARWWNWWRRDDGVATVLGAAMVVVIVTIALMVVDVGAAVSARHRAQSAADLAALAGAADSLDVESACAAAESVAQANSADLTGCAVENEVEVTVRVSVPVSFSVLGSGTALARARAGPA